MIPKTQNEKEILDRIQKLESAQFGGTKEENYSSLREVSKSISKGEAQNQFLGKRTRQSAIQRIKSFDQNYDDDSIRNLYGDELKEYEKELRIKQVLIERYGITKEDLE